MLTIIKSLFKIKFMQDYKKEFIDFMVESQVLKFGSFTLKSGRQSPFFMNAGAYITGSQLQKLGQYYAKAIYEKIGVVEENTETGIFGTAEELFLAGEALPVANRNEIRKGKAEILSDLEGKGVCSYEIEIEGFGKKESRNHKDMTIRITDERLLQLTGGIVQGMSGSPIIQDGKLVGAVTHVLINDPTKGYGIFIENMLDAAD